MARQALGLKKRRRIAAMLGRSVIHANVNSSWGRNWIEAFVSPTDSFLVNQRTGLFTLLTNNGKLVTTKPLWRKLGCCA
jgi:hypothetical protein